MTEKRKEREREKDKIKERHKVNPALELFNYMNPKVLILVKVL